MTEAASTQLQLTMIREKLKERPQVRPFPAAVSQLLAAFRDPDATSTTFAKIIECDAALAARLLRMANSSLYGLSNEIRSIEHAASVLGMRSLKTLTLSVTGASMFSDGAAASEDRDALWNHSLGCATVARLLAQAEGSVSPDEAFLAGIFHDVGKLFFLDVLPDIYTDLARANSGEDLVNQEKLRFGTTHEKIGVKSAISWELAEEIRVAIGYHHRPHKAPAHVEFAEVIHAADNLARAHGIGSETEPDLVVSNTLVQRFGLDEESLAKIFDDANEMFAETRKACAA
jgi:HD-like signal output (HDOD) protein